MEKIIELVWYTIKKLLKSRFLWYYCRLYPWGLQKNYWQSTLLSSRACNFIGRLLVCTHKEGNNFPWCSVLTILTRSSHWKKSATMQRDFFLGNFQHHWKSANIHFILPLTQQPCRKYHKILNLSEISVW